MHRGANDHACLSSRFSRSSSVASLFIFHLSVANRTREKKKPETADIVSTVAAQKWYALYSIYLCSSTSGNLLQRLHPKWFCRSPTSVLKIPTVPLCVLPLQSLHPPCMVALSALFITYRFSLSLFSPLSLKQFLHLSICLFPTSSLSPLPSQSLLLHFSFTPAPVAPCPAVSPVRLPLL